MKPLKGAALAKAQDWKGQLTYTPNLYELEQNLGMKAIIEGTKTLLGNWQKKFEIIFLKDNKQIAKMGKNAKKKLIINFVSTNKIQN